MIKANKDFIPQIAEELGLNEKEVSSILDFYFKSAKSKAEQMVDTDIYLYGLGTLQAKRRNIYKLLSYYKVRIDNVTNREMSSKIRDRIIEESKFKINQLTLLLERYKERDQRKKQLKLEQSETTGDIQE